MNAVEEVKESGILAKLPQTGTVNVQQIKSPEPVDQGLKGLPEEAVFSMDKKMLVEMLQNMPRESLTEVISTISEQLKAYIIELLNQVEREGSSNEMNPEMLNPAGPMMNEQLNENLIRGTLSTTGIGYGMNVPNASIGQSMRNVPNQGMYNSQYGNYDMGPVS
jgi:hypothetical protein